MTKRANLSFGTPASTNFNDETASQAAKPVNYEKGIVKNAEPSQYLNDHIDRKLTSFNCEQYNC